MRSLWQSLLNIGYSCFKTGSTILSHVKCLGFCFVVVLPDIRSWHCSPRTDILSCSFSCSMDQKCLMLVSNALAGSANVYLPHTHDASDLVKSAPAVPWLLLTVLDSSMMGKSSVWNNLSRLSVRRLGSNWHSKPLLLLLAVPAPEWARAAWEQSQHPMLSTWAQIGV